METESPGGVMEVTVQLSECGEEDAHAVFGMLGEMFRSDWDPEAAGGAGTGAEPDVWMAQFEVAPGGERASAVTLGNAVAAELQGSPQAVERLRHVLEDTFSVQEEMSVAGDQERQTRLRLEHR